MRNIDTSVRSQLKEVGWAIVEKLFDPDDVEGFRNMTSHMVEEIIRLQDQYGLRGYHLHPRNDDGTLDLAHPMDKNYFREKILSVVSH